VRFRINKVPFISRLLLFTASRRCKYFFFCCFMADWQASVKGALLPPTDLVCGVHIVFGRIWINNIWIFHFRYLNNISWIHGLNNISYFMRIDLFPNNTFIEFPSIPTLHSLPIPTSTHAAHSNVSLIEKECSLMQCDQFLTLVY